MSEKIEKDNKKNDDIDLVLIMNFLKRNFLKFISFTFLFLLIILNMTSEKKYKGIMKINKIDIENEFPTLSSLERYEYFDKKLLKDKNLKKESEILFNSPSKLKNVFNFYKEMDPKKSDQLPIDINTWINKVFFRFDENTKFATIEFEDVDKNKIPSILNKIKDELDLYFKQKIQADLKKAELEFQYFASNTEKSGEIQQKKLKELDELFSKTYFDPNKSKLQKVFDVLSIEVFEKDSNENLIFIIQSYAISIIIFTLFLLLIENKSGLIYDLNTLKKNINCRLLCKISSKEKDLAKLLLNKYISENDKNNYVLVPLDCPFLLKKSKISKVLTDIDNNLNLLDLSNLNNIDRYENIYFVAQDKKCSFKNIELINKLISIYQNKMIGWFYIEE